MTEQELQQYLKAHYPKENEGCEWKEFKNLKNDFNGKEKEVSVKVYARQANISKESFMTSEKSKQHQENVRKEPSVTSQKNSNVIKGLTQVQDLMLIAIHHDASITTTELSELTGITTRNVARNLKALQELGILERVGGRKNGYWKVNRR